MFYFLMNYLDSYSKKLSSITLAKMDNVILGLDVLLGVMSVYLASSSSFLYHGRCKLQRERERERDLSKTKAKGAITREAMAIL